MSDKSPDAFRTISEVADWLGVQPHVLRFWESKFSQVKPVKRAGGRRYYRPADMLLLGGIRKLLHEDGLTIKGAQKILREEGMAHVSAMSPPVDDEGNAVSEEADALDLETLAPSEPETEQTEIAAASTTPELVEATTTQPEQGFPESSADSVETPLPLGDANPPDVENGDDDLVQEQFAHDAATSEIDTTDDGSVPISEPDNVGQSSNVDDPAAEANPEPVAAELTTEEEDASQQDVPLPSFMGASTETPVQEIGAADDTPPVEPVVALGETELEEAITGEVNESPEELTSAPVPEAEPADVEQRETAVVTEEQAGIDDAEPQPAPLSEPETVLPSFMRAKATSEASEPEATASQPAEDIAPSVDAEPIALQAEPTAPEPELEMPAAPRARVVDAPDPIEAELVAHPDTLSAAFSLQDTTPDMVSKITPLIAQLAALRDRMAAERGR